MSREELLARLAARIAAVRRDHPVRVAVDGVDASGKTTLANALTGPLEALGRTVIRASIDGFHNPASVRRARGPDSPEGYYRDSFDHAALVRILLEPFGPGGSLRYRRAVFDFRSDSPVNARLETAAPDSILLFDGVFLLRPELRPYWDFSIFVRADFKTTLKRALDRDAGLFGTAHETKARYERRYIPGQMIYLEEAHPERNASVVVDNNDPANPRIVQASRDGSGTDPLRSN
jgi:uridine kinase